MQSLFFLENDSSASLLNGLALPSDIFLCVNYLVYERLTCEHPEYRHVIFIDELFEEQDYPLLHARTDDIATGWYRRSGVDISLYENISYGEITRAIFSRTYMLTVLVKYGEALRKAKKRWPEISTLYDDLSESENSFFLYATAEGAFFNKPKLASLVAEQLDLKHIHLKSPFEVPSSIIVQSNKSALAEENLKVAFKKVIRTFLERLSNRFQLFKSGGSSRFERTYLFPYFNTRTILNFLSNRFALPMMPIEMLRLKRLWCAPIYLDFNQIPYELTPAQRDFVAGLVLQVTRDRPDFTINEIDYSDLYFPALLDLMMKTFPKILRLTSQVRLGVRQFNIRKLVVNEEIDELQRAILAACRVEGTRTVFLDHGLQGNRIAQKVCERNQSDIVIVPSEYYQKVYTQEIYAPHRTYQCLGNPCLDPYPASQRKRIQGIRKVIFLSFEDNFYARMNRFSKRELYYKEIFSTFKSLQQAGIEIIYRPHPGAQQRYHEYVFEFFKVDRSLFVFDNEKPFREQIYEADLLISNVSSCFYEAIYAGVPPIFFEPLFDPSSFYMPLSGTPGREVLRAETGKELVAQVLAFKQSPESCNHFIDQFLANYGEKYLGLSDCDAGQKIAKYLSRA